MLFNIILLFIIVLILTVLLRYSRNHTEPLETFFDFPDKSHTNYIEDSTNKLNPLTNLINLPNPAIAVTPITKNDISGAIGNLKQNGSTLHPTVKYQTPDILPDGMLKAQLCQKAGPTCDAFDDPTFATNCGVSFDINGSGSDGKPHIGGLFVSFDDRAKQTAAAQNVLDTNSAPYDPFKVYQPTLGKAKPGTFGITKDSCKVVKEKVDCMSKKTFNSPNCTQCYTSQDFARVGSDTRRITSNLVLTGRGNIGINSGAYKLISLASQNLGTNPIQVKIPANAEGNEFFINISTVNSTLPYLSGYIQGETPKGTFKLDIMHLIIADNITGSKPRLNGTKYVNKFRCFSIVPGAGKDQLSLRCLMPFSFLSMYDGDALTCDNGPIITKASSATFLESDPCFGKANQPGNYKLECLQTRWMELGGTPEGTGYPSTKATADAIQKDANGNPLDIDTIVDNLALIMIRALTGKDASGKDLSIPDWNTASMYAVGIPINTPCDGPGGVIPLSQQCLSFLYSNRDANSRLGPTYTLPAGQYGHGKEGFANPLKKGDGFANPSLGEGLPFGKKKEAFANPPTPQNNTYNYPGTTLDPNTEAGLRTGQTLSSIGGIENVKQTYDRINRTANDNTLSNNARATAVKQAYNVNLQPPSANRITGAPQVFSAAGGRYDLTFEEGQARCAQFGATVATTAQLEEAQRNGANWCTSGWVAERQGKWPITTAVVGGCGGRTGIIEWTPGARAGVNCYGPKPDIEDPAALNGTILPFNDQMWSQPPASDKPTYLTIPSGYLETTGPQPSCFAGLSPEQAQTTCTALGAACAGFSYSKNGDGSGCYKGNHNAGINGNLNYMGYVKTQAPAVPAITAGRTIKLQYNHGECLNLAQILVYSTKGGANVITPNTNVVKSSGYQGDIYPSRNFVDGKGATFVHTSCNDVPWIQVDLGSSMPIYKIVVVNRADCCQFRVLGTTLSVLDDNNDTIYISNAISTTNTVYTWFPPNPTVNVDLPEDMPKPQRDRNAPPPGYARGPCRPGYYDRTKGHTMWWGCGVNCPGGTYFTDGACNCACIPNASDP